MLPAYKLGPVLHVGGEAAIAASPTNKALLSYTDRYEKPVELFKLPSPDAKWMYVPRGIVNLDTVPPGHDTRVSNFIGAIDCKFPPQGNDQALCLAKSINLLKSGQDHITEAPTGWGKTYHGCATAAAVGQTTLIIVTKEDLITGWHETLIDLIGVSPSDIGHCQQKKCEYKGKRFVIAMLKSLVVREYPPDFYTHFGLVIFDEVHRLGADFFQVVCGMFPARMRLGLSATPKRKDGRYRTFESHIGPMLVKGIEVPMKAKILVKKTGWKVPSYPKYDKELDKVVMVPLPVNPGKLGLVLKRLAKDPARNQQIVEFTVAAYKAGRQTILLSDLKEDHLLPMFHLLAKAGIPGEHMDYYIGGRTEAQLKQAKKARVCLATYAFTSEGTNNPAWDTGVPMTPRSDIKQSLGRILRAKDGKRQPVWLDLIDDDPVFQGFHYNRLKQYYEYGAEIVHV